MCGGLAGQAEHGPSSPGSLLAPSEALAGPAWREHGQLILCDSEAEMLALAGEFASERVQVMTRHPDCFLQRLASYGALFLGPRTHVA